MLICAPTLWSGGMFMDGLYYAAIAKNLANGLGSFWYLHHTEFSHPIFHEHPPLAIGLQSIFFIFFGDSIYIERFYSLFTFILTGIIIHLIWKEIIEEKIKNISWLPILFWTIIPLNSWACSNNMLENTMNIFVSLSIFFSIKSLHKNKLQNTFLAGTSISLAFLSKGFTGLFPLSIFLWYFIIFRKIKLKELVYRTAQLSFYSTMPFIILYFFYPLGIESIYEYINTQVIKSIQHIHTVNSRFFIIKKLILELLPVLIIFSVTLYFSIRKGYKMISKEKKWALFFLLLALSGVFPIMISLKQSGFYMLTTFPLFSIAFSILIARFIKSLTQNTNRKAYILAAIITITAFFISFEQIGKTGRNHDLIKDIKSIINEVPKNTVISIEENMHKDYQLIGYFARYANISLDKNNELDYHISFKKENIEKEGYNIINIKTNTLSLHYKE